VFEFEVGPWRGLVVSMEGDFSFSLNVLSLILGDEGEDGAPLISTMGLELNGGTALGLSA
jgi:hypothetical protein